MDIDYPVIVDYEDGPDDSLSDRPLSSYIIPDEFRLLFCITTRSLPELAQSIIWTHVLVDNSKNMFNYNLS
jgi:hypothetical protein